MSNDEKNIWPAWSEWALSSLYKPAEIEISSTELQDDNLFGDDYDPGWMGENC